MKTLIRKDFMSWAQEGCDVRAIALCEGTWFNDAINCIRDGDMGEKGKDGVYQRHWGGDYVYVGDGDYDFRHADPKEVDIYLSHCKISDMYDCGSEEIVAIVRGDISYVLLEKL